MEHISDISNVHVERVKANYSHLKDLLFSDVDANKEILGVDILVGANFLFNFQDGEMRRGDANEPVGIKTKLGWVLAGPIKETAEISYRERIWLQNRNRRKTKEDRGKQIRRKLVRRVKLDLNTSLIVEILDSLRG